MLTDAARISLTVCKCAIGIGYSLNRRTVRYNQRFADMFGYAGDEGIGRPTRDLWQR